PLRRSSTRLSLTDIYTLPLHDALPICEGLAVEIDVAQRDVLEPLQGHEVGEPRRAHARALELEHAQTAEQVELMKAAIAEARARSEEHTSELQSRENLVCRLLLEKKNN